MAFQVKQKVGRKFVLAKFAKAEFRGEVWVTLPHLHDEFAREAGEKGRSVGRKKVRVSRGLNCGFLYRISPTRVLRRSAISGKGAKQ